MSTFSPSRMSIAFKTKSPLIILEKYVQNCFPFLHGPFYKAFQLFTDVLPVEFSVYPLDNWLPAILGQSWANPGPILGLFWANPGPILGQPWVNTGPILGPILGQYWANTGPMLGQPWASTGPTLGQSWAIVEPILRIFMVYAAHECDFRVHDW